MDDLISRRQAIDALDCINGVEEVLKSLPSAQTERPKGRWIPQNHNKVNGMTSTAVYYYPKCSVCGHCADYTNFCPNCGADMRRGEQE